MPRNSKFPTVAGVLFFVYHSTDAHLANFVYSRSWDSDATLFNSELAHLQSPHRGSSPETFPCSAGFAVTVGVQTAGPLLPPAKLCPLRRTIAVVAFTVRRAGVCPGYSIGLLTNFQKKEFWGLRKVSE
jgi:hypothetical protein